MEVDVPLVFTGMRPAVEETGGTLLHNVSSVRVKALPTDIPHEIEVNVSTLVSLDVAIHVKDLNFNRDLVHLLTDGETLVATVVPPRVEEEPEPVVAEGEEAAEGEEGAEGAEGAEGEAAEGGEASGEGARAEATSARTPPTPDPPPGCNAGTSDRASPRREHARGTLLVALLVVGCAASASSIGAAQLVGAVRAPRRPSVPSVAAHGNRPIRRRARSDLLDCDGAPCRRSAGEPTTSGRQGSGATADEALAAS